MMSHPFAIQIHRPRSLFSLRSPLLTPDTKEAPQPSKPKAKAVEALPPPRPRTPLIQLGSLAPNRTPPSFHPTKADAYGHYVRHSSRLTLLLSGQREGTCIPSYSNGETIEGILAMARPSLVLALDVKVRAHLHMFAFRVSELCKVQGTIHIHEIAGAGSVTVNTIDEKIYSWVAARHGSFPPRASFRYSLPRTYRDSFGKEYPLPPTFAGDLHGIPGFSVKVSYAIVVNLTLLREASSLWRGVSKWVCSADESSPSGGADGDSLELSQPCSVCVPFRYAHRTRPSLPGPFPSNRTRSDKRPQTLFVYQMRSLRQDAPSIKVHVRTVCSSCALCTPCC